MNNSSQPQSQRECRFVLRHSPEVIVRSRGFMDDPKTYSAELVDLSQRGAKLVSREPIATRESLELELNVEDLGLRFSVAVNICWCKPGEAGTWVLGCSLTPALPEGIFDTLAKGGHVDRRFDPRLDRSLGLDALWELNGDVTPAILQDYSQRGFCIRVSEPGRIGEQFHLRLSEPYHLIIVATAVWQLKVVDGFLIGCSFLNDRDFDRLNQLSESDSANKNP